MGTERFGPSIEGRVRRGLEAHCAAMALMLAALGCACDPGRAAELSVDAAAKNLEAVEDAKAGSRAEFATCMTACVGDSTRKVSDRATCQLNCEAATAVVSTPEEISAGKAVLLRFDACANPCEGRSATDRATCRLNCAQTTPSDDANPRLDDVQSGCATTCLDALIGCDAACSPPSPDASTCRLYCGTDVTRCLSRCELGVSAPS